MEMKSKKKTQPLCIRLSAEEKNKIRELSENGGYSNMTAFVRDKTLNNSDIEIHHKMNLILNQLKEIKNGN
jgi:hypothetical protein